MSLLQTINQVKKYPFLYRLTIPYQSRLLRPTFTPPKPLPQPTSMLTPQPPGTQSAEQHNNIPRQASGVDYFFEKYKRQLKIQQEPAQPNIKAPKHSLQQRLALAQSYDEDKRGKDRSVKQEQHISRRGLLKMEAEGHTYRVRQRGNKKIDQIDLEDPEEVEAYLKKCCRDYHKSLMDGARQNLKLQQEQLTLKKEEKIISIDENLSHFPLESEYPKLKEFQSIRELRDKLKQHEQDILKDINHQQIKSVFYDNLQQKIKKGEGGKTFHNFVCRVPGCNSIIKCSLDLDRNIYDIYLLRNRHNHTITGHVIEPDKYTKPEVVVLDEELHEMFGFNKGVRSQTRNLRYVDPLQRKKIEYQKKRQRILKRRRLEESRKKQMLSQSNGQQDTQNDDSTESKSKTVDHSKKYFVFNNKKVEDIQFKNLPQELRSKGYIVDTPDHQTKVLQMAFITKKQLLDLALEPSTLRITHRQNTIRLDRRRGIANTIWSVLIVTTLNHNLKPLILAVFLFSKPLVSQLSKVLTILLKYFPKMKYLVSEYQPNVLNAIKNEQTTKYFQLLLDHSDIFKLLKKYCRKEEHIKVLKELMNPVNCYNRQSFEKYLRKRNEKKLLERFQQFREYTLISQREQFPFQGVDVDLAAEKELMLKIKQRVRSGSGRYSLKLHLQNIFEWIHSYNKSSQIIPQQTLQIQKFHHDYNLKAVRTSVAPSILNQFYLNYGQSATLEPSLNDHGQFWFQRGKVRVRQLICSCGYTRLIGIPCKHLISVLKDKNLSYLASFDKRWIVRQEAVINEAHEQRHRSRDEDRKKQKKAKNSSKGLVDRQKNQGQQQQDMQQQNIFAYLEQ